MNKIEHIVETLKKASEAYYNTGTTTMSDNEFDKLKNELKELDPNNDFFKEVGAPALRNKVKLTIHMGSQNKATTDQEMYDWYNKHNQPEVIMSDKMDGCSVEITYKNGKLFRVLSRGDGKMGQDLTENAKVWSNIKHNLASHKDVVVRAEAYLPVSVWKKYFTDSANPRNATAGTISRLDGSNNAYISIAAFDISVDGMEFNTVAQKFKLLKELGFDTVRWFEAKTEKQLKEYRDRYVNERPNLDFWIDGIIVCINDVKKHKELGYSGGGTKPKYSLGWKFETEKAITKVIGMTITVGHTGALVPTAQLEPVYIGGTIVSNVLLNNFTYLEEKNVNIGDDVEVQKSGDIIPYLNMVVKKNSIGTYPRPKDWNGYKVEMIDRHLMIVDPDCPDITFQRVRNWVDKTNIKFLGDELLMSLFESDMVKDIPDLYDVSVDSLSNLSIGNGVLGKSNAKKVMIEIDKTRKMGTDLFMGSIGVKFLGRQQAKKIQLSTPQEYLNVSVNSLSNEDGMGPNKAKDMIDSIKSKKELIEKLLTKVNVEPLSKPKVNKEGKLFGKSFCFTGVRPTKDEESLLVSAGGEIKSGVSKGLTHLVQKDKDSMSEKTKKALSYGTEIISYDDFQKLINE
jgi:DNA ligase (NAD+)